MKNYFNYNSLEDYIISNPLDIDASFNDGWGANFSVKGCKINATILFIDIVNFSGRTKNLSPIETLTFVNNFFTWITAEALLVGNCIVDKYIGDEIMVVFSDEFGSENSFLSALQSAILIADTDYLCYWPNMGIASGEVVLGYVGTPKKYNCSVFGYPVTLASRCTAVKSQIVFPSNLWKDYSLEDIYPNREIMDTNGNVRKHKSDFLLKDPWEVELKNIGKVMVRSLFNNKSIRSSITAEQRAIENIKHLREK